MRPCPKCGSSDSYVLKCRVAFCCKECAHQFTETSGTMWSYPKISAETRRQILEAAETGASILSISKTLGIQYKTVWNTIRKQQAANV